MFGANQGSQIAQQIAEAVERPRLGRVIEVFEHVAEDDKSNFEVDVEMLDTRDNQLRAVAWQAPQSDEVKVPKVGDKVIVEFRGRSKKVPIARNAVYTNKQRPPKATAGSWRKRVPSGSSPAGDGDLYIESSTFYQTDPASAAFEPENATPETSYIRLAKKGDDMDESFDGATLPISIELLDNPVDDEAHVIVELNKVDGSDSSGAWGLKLDLKTGEMKLLDGDGYGIVSDGSGNFTWYEESLNFVDDGTTTSL